MDKEKERLVERIIDEIKLYRYPDYVKKKYVYQLDEFQLEELKEKIIKITHLKD